ncbi:MAG: LssY C-terminal domain-containing protein [Acidobacteria bacterium]|nr:LssY C-terminal domain-containing protein [Acidobacteriota bacterium]
MLSHSLGPVFLFVTLLPIVAEARHSQEGEQEQKQKTGYEVSGDKQWLDTGLDIKAGDTLRFTASGTLKYPGAKETGPDGLARNWWDLLRTLPLNDAKRGALLGRIGDSRSSRPFLIGTGRESKAITSGRLYLGVNQTQKDKSWGAYQVLVEILQRAQETQPVDESTLPRLAQEILDSIPTRVQDPDGNPGDRVNFLVIGTEQKLKRALQAGGWTIVNRTAKDAVIQGAISVLSRAAYTQLPMSELMLFGRAQDYGFAQADPVVVVASRHHFRIWKAPFTADGQTVWVGAGTHDVGFDRDQRTGGITHKIDPDTDKEREFIGKTLEESGEVAKTYYMTPANPVTEAKTAHGQEYRSDGRVLIVILTADREDVSQAFSNLFCSVLREINPDGGEWGDCAQYLETPSAESVELPPIPDKYRILIVPGLMNTCFAGVWAYKEGQEYLRSKYGLVVDLLPVPNDSCEDNAELIAEFLKRSQKEDSRKFIVLGYSKGAPDTQAALAQDRQAASSVAAFISVAGAIGGSPVADVMPRLTESWIKQYRLPGCEGDLSKGLKSLTQLNRRAFLAKYPEPVVPTYSIPAISDQAGTSKLLMQTWQILSAFSKWHDGQLTRLDAVVAGSKYLGSALADHFAVAMPFETSEESIKSGADKNHYPRTALLESLIRYVIGDLEAKK